MELEYTADDLPQTSSFGRNMSNQQQDYSNEQLEVIQKKIFEGCGYAKEAAWKEIVPVIGNTVLSQT